MGIQKAGALNKQGLRPKAWRRLKRRDLCQYRPAGELDLGFQATQKQEPPQVQVDGFQMRRQILRHQ